MSGRRVLVPESRLARWVAGFSERHEGMELSIDADGFTLLGGDGEIARAAVPFPPLSGTEFDTVLDHVRRKRTVAVLLVRRGGYLCALVSGEQIRASKLGRRHIQGRTSAGGWSQQRYARRRAKQADELVDAVRDHARTVWEPLRREAEPAWLVTGGDPQLVHEVMSHHGLAGVAALERGRTLEVSGDPDRQFLQNLPELLTSTAITLNPATG